MSNNLLIVSFKSCWLCIEQFTLCIQLFILLMTTVFLCCILLFQLPLILVNVTVMQGFAATESLLLQLSLLNFFQSFSCYSIRVSCRCPTLHSRLLLIYLLLFLASDTSPCNGRSCSQFSLCILCSQY